MQSVARIAVSALLITSALASANHNSVKLRRNGVLSLYPFPRVGRALKQTWQVPLEDLLLDDYKPEQKRQLYAFPRVGREPHDKDEQALSADSTDQHAQEQKRQMYAFPRVGRSEPLTLRQLSAGPLQPQPQLQMFLSSLFQPRPLHPQPVIDPLSQYQEVLRSNPRLRSLLELMLGVRRNSLVKRVSGSTDTTGMWFGPRLGRARGGDDDSDFTMHHQNNDRRELESIDQTQNHQEIDEDRKKRQAE